MPKASRATGLKRHENSWKKNLFSPGSCRCGDLTVGKKWVEQQIMRTETIIGKEILPSVFSLGKIIKEDYPWAVVWVGYGDSCVHVTMKHFQKQSWLGWELGEVDSWSRIWLRKLRTLAAKRREKRANSINDRGAVSRLAVRDTSDENKKWD